jgi:hypothetical protein
MNEENQIEEQTPKVASRKFVSSETLGKLSEALAKAQGEIEGAKKDSANPFFHSRYADLASVWDACRGPLSKHGLAVIQLPGRNGEGLFVDSILSHASWEWISSRLFINPVKDDPQGIGSAITYARRYGLQALVGIAPEDDDGEAAMGRQQKREDAAKTQKNAPLEIKGRKPKASVPAPPDNGKDQEIPMFNGPKHEALSVRLKGEGVTEEDFIAAAKFAKLIPENAKAFRRMSEATAAKFVEEPEVVGVAMKSWRERKI